MMNSEDRIKYTAKAEVKHVMNVAETSNFGQECFDSLSCEMEALLLWAYWLGKSDHAQDCYEKMVFEHESGHDRQME